MTANAFTLTQVQGRTVYVDPDSIQAIEVFRSHTRIYLAGHIIEVRETPIRSAGSWAWTAQVGE